MRFFVIFPLWIMVPLLVLLLPAVLGAAAIYGAVRLVIWAIDTWRVKHGKEPMLKPKPKSPQQVSRGGNPYLGDWTQANSEWARR